MKSARKTAEAARKPACGGFARKVLPATVALIFGQGAWAEPINAGGDSANLPVNGVSSTATGPASVSGNTLTVNVPGRAVIDWASFNIGAGYTVYFNGSGSAVLNRVPLSGGESSINGILSAPGKTVMLMNPNGILFGSTAQVNVGSLVATSGTINETRFVDEGVAAITNASGRVRNLGHITVEAGGLAALVAPSVSNQGHITATGGTIVLAGTTAVTVSMSGGLYEFAVAGPTDVANAGTLSGATILLSTGDAANLVSGTINLSGIQQADRIEVNGNHVVLASDLDAATVTGSSRTVDVRSGAHVQDGVDIAAPGATVNVYPGNYTEVAAGRSIGIPGIYDLGLLLNKAGLRLRGVDASGNPIASASGVQAWISAGASTNFGMNHGVVADNVTVEGLGFKPYVPGANKTIEIAGDNFTFRNSAVDNRGVAGGAGALYFGELLAGHDIARLAVTGSLFLDGSVSLQNGVGAAADGVTWQAAADRVISDNTFTGSSNYRFGGLLLTGKMDEVPWRPMPIGAATVTGNRFSGFDDSVLVRGEQQGVDLRQIMADNSFDRSVLVTDSAGHARTELYESNCCGTAVMRPRSSIQSSIQAGINRAVNGDTVTVGAGTYTQTLTLNLHKSITLAGAGEALTTIDARTVSGYGILVDADHVSLSDFTLYGPTANASSSYGIKVQPAGSARWSRVNDFRITNVTTRGAFKAELDLNGVVGATIDHVTADGAPVGNDTGTTAGAGIQITDSANVVIRDSTTRNNAWGGVALFQTNRFFDQQTANVTVEGNNRFTEALPLYMQDESASLNFGALGIAGFDYAVRNTGSADNSQFTWLQKTLSNAIDFAVNVPVPGSSTVQGWSGTGLTQTFDVGVGSVPGGGTRAMSIAAALAASGSGADINIGAGTYAEDVVLGGLRDLRFGGAAIRGLTVNAGAAGSGIGGSVLADGPTGFVFNAPVVLLGDTTLATAGANIVFNADVQNAGAGAKALTLRAGAGDIVMTSGGTSGNPLGQLRAVSRNFTLRNDLWATGAAIDVTGAAVFNGQLHVPEVPAAGPLQEIEELREEVPVQVLVPPVQISTGTGASPTAPLQGGPVADFASPLPPAGDGGASGGETGAPTPSGSGTGPGRGAQLVAAPVGAGGAPAPRSAPGRAGEALDRGRSVEIDLSPGN